MHDQAASLDLAFPGKHPLARLRLLRSRIEGRIVFTTSFGLEDQFLTDLIFANDLAIDVATLDTGRLFPETYAVWAETEQKYGRRIRAYYPSTAALENASSGVESSTAIGRATTSATKPAARRARAMPGNWTCADFMTTLAGNRNAEARRGRPNHDQRRSRGNSPLHRTDDFVWTTLSACSDQGERPIRGISDENFRLPPSRDERLGRPASHSNVRFRDRSSEREDVDKLCRWRDGCTRGGDALRRGGSHARAARALD